MELQSQSNSTDAELGQDELKHSPPILSSTHSKGIQKCFHGGCRRNVCCHQVSKGASDAYTLACERRQTFSGHKSILNRLYSNFTADMDNALLSLHREIYWLMHKTRTRNLSQCFFSSTSSGFVHEANQLGSEPGIFHCIYI